MLLKKLVPYFLIPLLLLTSCSSNNSEKSASGSFPVKFKLSAKKLQKESYQYDFTLISSQYQNSNFSDCETNNNPSACYLSILVSTSEGKSVEVAITQLSQLSQNYCNQVASSFGAYLASKKLASLSIIESDPKSCGDSFSQGYIFSSLVNGSQDAKDISKFCNSLGKGPKWNCSIYLGHYFLNQNLADPVAMTENCYLIPSPDDTKGDHMTFRRACLSGLWQRFFNNESVIKQFNKMNPSATDIFSFCLASKRSAKEVCLQEDSHPFWVMEKFKDVNEKFSACRALEDVDLTDQCNFGMGRGVADHINRVPAKLFQACAQLKLSFDFEYCMIAAGEAYDREVFKKDINTVCPDLAPKCLLGLGAATYGMHNGDSNGAMLACNEYFSAKRENALCQIGVFRGFSRLSYVHILPQVVDEIYARCDAIAGVEAQNCLLGSFAGSLHFIEKMGGEKAIIDYCNTSKFQELCGSAMASIYLFENIPVTTQTCIFSEKQTSLACANWLGMYAKGYGNTSLCDNLTSELAPSCLKPDEKYIFKKYIF